MTHTVSIDVAAPVQLYDAFHAALVEHPGAVSTACSRTSPGRRPVADARTASAR
jgi:hypothetical protein